MPSPRTVLRVLLAVALAAALVPIARPAAALDAATFVSTTSAWAQAEEREHGVPASVAMAQAILESGWGESSLTKNAKNWFGIKCSSTVSPNQNGCFSVSTTEYDANGTAYTSTAQFRKYDTDQKSFIDHGYFLSSLSRYAKAFNYTNNPDRFIVEVHLGGYATDPQYANKVINLMVKYDLYQYNVTAPATGAGELVIRPQTQATLGATAYVTGLLSPGGAGRSILTQAYTSAGWTTDQTITAGVRGQFSIPLTFGTNSGGVTRFRVQADASTGTQTSAEFSIERVGTIEVLAVASVTVGQPAQLRGTATGYAGYAVAAQELVDGVWQVHSSSTVAEDGTFQFPLTSAPSAGTRSFRAQLTASSTRNLTSTTVTATWEAEQTPSPSPSPSPSTPALQLASIQRTSEQRIGGADRYEVAANISRWLPRVDTSLVLVASGEVFTDALSAAPLAAFEHARLLLTGAASLPPSVAAELARSRPSEIVIAGGPNTVSPAVAAALAAYAPVTRIDGADRYAVAAGIAARIPSKNVVVASGELFSDALSAGPLAAKLGGPLLLVRAGELPPATAAALIAIAPESVTILGGSDTVGDAVLNEIARITGATTTRVGGADRYEVAANVAKKFFPNADTAVFASGLVFPDGLSGTPLAHSYSAPILLSTGSCVSAYTNAAIGSLKPMYKFYVGGPSSVTSSGVACGAASTVRKAINPQAETAVASTVPAGSPAEEAIYFIPHQDDELVSMVGGIVRDTNAGRRVHVYLMNAGYWTGVKALLCDVEQICLTNAQITASRNAELLSSLEILGVPSSNVHFLYTQEEQPAAPTIVRQAIADVVGAAGDGVHLRTMSWLDGHPSHYVLGYALRDACAAASSKNDCLWFQSPLYQARPEALQYEPIASPRGSVVAAPAWQVTAAAAAYRENYPTLGRYSIGWRSVSSQISWIAANNYSWAHGVTWASASDEAAAAAWIQTYQVGSVSTARSSTAAFPLEEER